MSAPTVTAREVETVVDSVLDEFRTVQAPAAVVIHARPVWEGPAEISVGDIDFTVVPCPSVLAVRAALAEAAGPIVILSECDKTALGIDVCARIATGRPRSSDRRDAVKRAFGALHLDPRLAHERWLTDELLAAAPPTGYPKITGGVLTLNHALRALADIHLALAELSPAPDQFLAWASQPESRNRVLKAPERFVNSLFDDILYASVPFAPEVLAAMRGDEAVDPVVLGLVAGVISGAESNPQSIAAEALFRSRIGGRKLAQFVGKAWGEAASDVLDEQLEADLDVDTILQRAQQLLADLDATELAYDNDLLQASFDHRLSQHGLAIIAALAGESEAGGPVETVASIGRHRLARPRRRQLARAEMAVRLTQWVTDTQFGAPRGLADAGRLYRDDSGWVDYARRTLREPESEPNLALAYGQLLDRVSGRRVVENRLFAHQLAAWDQSHSPSVLPIEDVLKEVVAPIAALQPVLLLVMDGMGWDVWHQLSGDLSRRGWSRIVDGERSVDRPCFAAFPTVTEHSRTSLLTGRLFSGGGQDDEKKEFPANRISRRYRRRRSHPRSSTRARFHVRMVGASQMRLPTRSLIQDSGSWRALSMPSTITCSKVTRSSPTGQLMSYHPSNSYSIVPSTLSVPWSSRLITVTCSTSTPRLE